MLKFQRVDLFLRPLRNQAFAVKFAVRARMRLVAGRQKVGGNIALGGDIGDNLDFLIGLGEPGEKFGIGIAFKDVPGNGVAGRERRFQPPFVSLVEIYLRLQHSGGIGRDRRVLAKRQIEQNLDRRATLHVRQKFERESSGDFRDHSLAKDDLFQEGRLLAGRAGGAGERLVDEKIERGGTVFTATIPDMRDKLLHKAVIIDRLWFQPLFLAVFDLFKIGVIQRHFVPHENLSAALYCRTGSMHRINMPDPCTAPTHRIYVPDQCAGPMCRTNVPDQCAGPMYRTNALD